LLELPERKTTDRDETLDEFSKPKKLSHLLNDLSGVLRLHQQGTLMGNTFMEDEEELTGTDKLRIDLELLHDVQICLE
jgi:hypothetical protein